MVPRSTAAALPAVPAPMIPTSSDRMEGQRTCVLRFLAMASATERFRYGPKPGQIVLVVFFFGLCGAVLAYAAANEHPIRLWPLPTYVTGGPVYLLSALSFAFVVVAIAQVVRGRSLGPRELVVTTKYIEAPRSPWTRRTVRITKTSIQSSRESETMGTRVVTIIAGEEKLALSNRTVGDNGYAAVLSWLRS